MQCETFLIEFKWHTIRWNKYPNKDTRTSVERRDLFLQPKNNSYSAAISWARFAYFCSAGKFSNIFFAFHFIFIPLGAWVNKEDYLHERKKRSHRNLLRLLEFKMQSANRFRRKMCSSRTMGLGSFTLHWASSATYTQTHGAQRTQMNFTERHMKLQRW